MAAAADPMLSYRHVDPNDPPADRFDKRGEHLLYMSQVAGKSFGDWVEGIPIREVVGSAVSRAHMATFQELILPFATLHDDARHYGYGQVYIKEECFSRMAAAVLQLAPGAGCVLGTRWNDV